ncbi:FixH family protein [Aquibacillus kalidii]|uniref:FixH family protein n=1 Tax=Aquibacillus kalidii TaxID=2762597 RepID=UPI00164753CB|nr:FixH family protein [Aquibacillus kalidii]
MKNILLLILTISLLSACGQAEDNHSDGGQDEEALASIEAQLHAPETAEIGAETSVKVTVTQADSFVDDADEVMFEVWKDGLKEESEMIESEFKGDGVYVLHTTFDQPGTYTVQSHVTARGMHTMPKAEILVGSDSATEESEATQHHDDAHAESSSSEEHSHHDSELAIELDHPDSITPHQGQSFSVKVTNNDQTLTDAAISLQISHTEKEDGSWVDLEETDNNQYVGDVTFGYSGEYLITVHVKKDELHDHKEFHVTVE